MGPHRPGSWRSLSSGPDLSEAPPTCKWTRIPYPQPRQPWKTSSDLIRISEDLPGLWRKFSPTSRHGATSRSADREIHPVITVRVHRPRMGALVRWPYKAAWSSILRGRPHLRIIPPHTGRRFLLFGGLNQSKPSCPRHSRRIPSSPCELPPTLLGPDPLQSTYNRLGRPLADLSRSHP
jgi:hypothetical protein